MHQHSPPNLQKDIKEIKDRTRRVETRVTRWLESQGFETNIQKPAWHEDRLIVPTSACSLVDCLSIIPPEWPNDKGIDVYVHDDYLMTVYLSPED